MSTKPQRWTRTVAPAGNLRQRPSCVAPERQLAKSMRSLLAKCPSSPPDVVALSYIQKGGGRASIRAALPTQKSSVTYDVNLSPKSDPNNNEAFVKSHKRSNGRLCPSSVPKPLDRPLDHGTFETEKL